MSDILPTFPVDDMTLNLIEHAMGGAYTVDPDGTHHLVGADFTLTQLLDFLSGYDPALSIPYVDENLHTHDDTTIYPNPIYTEHCVIRALITEVRRLRQETSDD